MKKFCTCISLSLFVAVCTLSYDYLSSVNAQDSAATAPATAENTLIFRYVRTGRAGDPAIMRAKIPGGWLVKGQFRQGDSGGFGLTFVPDPDHAWDGTSLD